MPYNEDGLYYSNDSKYMGANDDGAWSDFKKGAGKFFGAINSGGDKLVDLAAGGGPTNVDQYNSWDESQMQSARDAQYGARGQQSWLGDQYRNQIAGNGPSVAENQMRSGNEQAMQNQLSMSRGGRGPLGQGNAQYNAQVNLANQSQQVNRDAATLRAQEQLGAMQNYGQLSGQMRGQDIDMFGGEAGWQGTKADSYNTWAKAQADASESYKDRRGSGFSGLMSGASAAAGAMSLGVL